MLEYLFHFLMAMGKITCTKSNVNYILYKKQLQNIELVSWNILSIILVSKKRLKIYSLRNIYENIFKYINLNNIIIIVRISQYVRLSCSKEQELFNLWVFFIEEYYWEVFWSIKINISNFEDDVNYLSKDKDWFLLLVALYTVLLECNTCNMPR